MKKLLCIITLLLFAFANLANKNKKEKKWQPEYKLEQAFIKLFGTVENVQWQWVSPDLISARFTSEIISLRPVKAFFDHSGVYMGMTQQTSIYYLPERLAEKGQKFIESYMVTDVIEYWHDGAASYYIKVCNDGGSKLVKASLTENSKFVEAGE